MPVTAKLSQKFYERLGDDIANELVDWFNAVDATYRADLERLNEANFARFDAKLELRVAELRSDFERRWTALDAKLESEVAGLRSEVERRWTALDAKLEQRTAQLETHMAQLEARMVKWMFAFWSGTVVPLGGLILALHLM